MARTILDYGAIRQALVPDEFIRRDWRTKLAAAIDIALTRATARPQSIRLVEARDVAGECPKREQECGNAQSKVRICLQVVCAMQTTDEFIARLPGRDSPYSVDKLSQAETAALKEALLDGFGDVFAPNSKPLPLPANMTVGLLNHSFFVKITPECDQKEYERKFWADSEGHWSTLRMFPLHFVPTYLRLYFANQLDRFCEYLVREHDGFASVPEEIRKGFCAALAVYDKPWYEYYALRFFDSIETLLRGGQADPRVNLRCARLGRLVEQYYWRFRFEDAAISGVDAHKGASAGGRARAALHMAEHSAWQSLASEIWARRPGLSKIAVAETIKKQKSSVRTAKHIARFIKHP